MLDLHQKKDVDIVHWQPNLEHGDPWHLRERASERASEREGEGKRARDGRRDGRRDRRRDRRREGGREGERGANMRTLARFSCLRCARTEREIERGSGGRVRERESLEAS